MKLSCASISMRNAVCGLHFVYVHRRLIQIPAGMTLRDVNERRADVWLTARLDNHWISNFTNFTSDYVVRYYIGTTLGTYRSFPGQASDSAFDP